MVEKTYLRYVVGPQGGAVVSSASLNVAAALIQAQYRSTAGGGSHGGSSGPHRGHRRPVSTPGVTAVFVPSLEAVRVFSIRSGDLLHTLIPAEATMPLEVTALQVVPLPAHSMQSPPMAQPSSSAGRPTTAVATSTSTGDAGTASPQGGWMLLVGYSNGYAAAFTCSSSNNYGLPVCRFYALGHKIDTHVLALAVDAGGTILCTGGQDTDITVWDLVMQEASFRLRGHRGGVVSLVCFSRNGQSQTRHHTTEQDAMAGRSLVLSASADGLVKCWDLELRQCLHTIVASDAQITAMVADSAGRRLYCGLRENYIQVYNTEQLLHSGNDKGDDDDGSIVNHGVIRRAYSKPITFFAFSDDGNFLLACTSRTVEVYRVLTADDVRKKVQRKRKRQRETGGSETAADDSTADRQKPGKKLKKGKAEQQQETEGGEEEGDVDEGDAAATAASSRVATTAEEVILLRTFFLTEKIRSACFLPSGPASREDGLDGSSSPSAALHIAVTYNNNNVETFTTHLTHDNRSGSAVQTLTDIKLRHSLDWKGHQSDIRDLAFVDTDTALLSLSREKIVLWSMSVKEDLLESDHTDTHDFYDAKEANLMRVEFKGSLHPIGSISMAEATCMAAISSTLCCAGQADGSVLLLDVASSGVLSSESAIHIGGVKDVVKRPDNSGFLTIGSDRRMLLWTVGLPESKTPVNDDSGKASGGATLVQEQDIELTEMPLCAAFSPDLRYLAVGLQSNNIQLFFADTMKPYLSLFGHKLPPSSISFSTDGTLVASVGLDKSLRFWGTDFGDCHRAIHAHDDYITAVQFVEDTHYVFTSSMDGSVKEWDGDNWTMVQVHRQHQRGVWAVAVTSNGTCVATSGADKCIRCLLRTQDIVFPQEEEEKMAQAAMDEEAAKRAAMQRLDGPGNGEVGVAGQQTAITAEAAERLMEALDIISVEQQRRANQDDSTPRHPMLMNMTEWEFLWSIIETIRPSELRHTLLALTSVHVDALLTALETMATDGVVLNNETAARIVLTLVMMPYGGNGGSVEGLRTTAVSGEVSEARGARRLESLRRCISAGLDASTNRMDYSVAGLQMVRQHLENESKIRFFDRSKVQGYRRQYHSRALPEKHEAGGKKV